MNRIFTLVWSHALSAWVVASEFAARRGKQRSSGGSTGALYVGRHPLRFALSCVALGPSAVAFAADLPVGGQVVLGSGQVGAASGTTLTVNQSSAKLAIDWQSFDIAAGHTVTFSQPSRSAIALNRVVGSAGSKIMGQLDANGRVFLVNPNGVLFGAGAEVNVGGLVASTLDLSSEDFAAGNYRFKGDGSHAAVVNQGRISAADGGAVALLGGTVSNQGVIAARLGTVALAAGNAITVDFAGDGLLSVQIDEPTRDALVENRQLIQADGGQVLMSAKASDALLRTVVNNSGVIEARTLGEKNGRIVLLGGFDGGTVQVAGTLDASAQAGGDGGFIETSGARVKVADDTLITTLASNGKTGTWLVDPRDFTIASGGGALTASGVGATTLASALASSNVTLQTDNSSGTDDGDINVNAALSWSADTTLTLDAYADININAAIAASGTDAGLVLNYGNYATAGSATGGTDYNVSAPVTLSGSNASLAINGQAYTLVHSMAELDAIDSTGLSGSYALAQDLDAGGTTYSRALVGVDVSAPFAGTFAGLGHTIGNLTIAAGSSSNYTGLFGYTGSGSVIRDVGLVGGSVSGANYVGGLVGANRGAISNVYATGSVSGNFRVGGLVGANHGAISNVYATGSVSGSGSYQYLGGLVGANHGAISNAYATGSVSGGLYYLVGGLVGRNSFGTISNAYATGSVSGSSYVGGLAGRNYDSEVRNSYWDSSSTGQSSAVGLDQGDTSASAVDGSSAYSHTSYANLGTWGETASGSGVWIASDSSGSAWVMVEGSTRPFLYSEWSTGIRNAHQLQLMAVDTSASYTLAADIDAGATGGGDAAGMWSTAGFSPVGNTTVRFTGTLDGQGHTLSDLTISASGNNAGLFGMTASSSVIRDIGLLGGSVSGANYVGGLVGYSLGSSISGAYTTGSVSGSVSGSGSYIGGLVGFNDSGTISNAHATGSTSGLHLVGGLAGRSSGSISNAYATGSVSGGGTAVGGLVGLNSSGSISNAYATGSVNGSGGEFGGLVGANSFGSIGNAYATGNVSGGGNNAGGLVGYNEGDIFSGFSNTYATGSVSGGQSVGGLVGHSEGGIFSNSYATGSVSGSQQVGGLAGYIEGGKISASFWLLANSTVGIGVNIGATISDVRGLGSTETNSLSTYTAVGWDIDGQGGSGSIWRSYDGYTTPLLRSFLTALTVSSDAGKTYDGTTTGSVASYATDLADTDASLLLGSLDYTSASKNAGSYSTADGSLVLSGLFSTQQGYDISYGGSLAIAKRDITGSIAAAGKTYDGTTATTTTGTLSGVIDGDSVSLASSGAFTDKNAGAGKTVTVGGTLSGSDAGNYILSTNATALADILAKAITGNIAADSKTYDGTTTAITTGSLSGVIDGDSVSLASSGAFADKNAGAGKTVTVGGALSGSDAGNYILTTNATTLADILAKAITGSIGADSKTYDGTTTATTAGTLSGVIDGDSVSLVSSGAFADKNAGAGKTVTVGGALSGSDADNYALTAVNTTALADILAKAITGSIAADSKTYDGTTAATTAGSLSGVIDGDSVSLASSGAFADKNAGAGKTVTVGGTLSGSDAGNYILTTNATALADILAKAISGSISADSKTYDGTTAATTAGTLSGVIDGDSLSLASSGAFADKNAGAGKTVTVGGTLSGSDAGNYILTTNATALADILAKAITGSIGAAGKTYDGTTAATTEGTLSGVIDGDSVSLASSGTFADKNAGAGKTVTVGGALSGSDAGNYALTAVNTTALADILAKAITGSIAAAGKTYDGTTAATTTGSLSGVIDGDSLSLASSGTFADKNAGAGKTITVGGVLSGSDAGNYILTTNATALADILAKAITGSIAAASKTYDGTTAATTTGTLSGVIDGDSVSLASSGTFADKNAGAGKTVTVGGVLSGSDAGNYILTSNSTATADIDRARLLVAANEASKFYDGQAFNGDNGVTYQGLVNGENSGVLAGTLVYGGTAQGALLPGHYNIEPAGLTANNYRIEYQAGDLTISGNAASMGESYLSARGALPTTVPLPDIPEQPYHVLEEGIRLPDEL